MERELFKSVIQFILSTPSINSMGGQQTLVYQAGLDQSLQNQIQFNSNAQTFTVSLISLCQEWGILHDGRNPLVAIIESACHSVGPQKQKIGARLIERILGQPYITPVQEEVKEEPPTLVQGGNIEVILVINNEDYQAFLDVLKDSHAEDFVKQCFVKREVTL